MLIPPDYEPQRQHAIDELAAKNRLTNPKIANFWHAFLNEVTRIPRDSGAEERVTQWLIDWSAEIPGAQTETDQAGNVLIRIPATPGCESAPGLIFQGHADMVCVAEANAPVDPAQDGVIPQLTPDGEWLRAIGTTLGADNGIALAVMKVLAQTDIEHGPFALLITTSEETGLDGAKALRFNLDDYRYLVNLDSEDENIATISSAGGGDTILELPLNQEELVDQVIIEIEISGLRGGHSGVDIDKGRANAIKVLVDVLSFLEEKTPFSLVSFSGGSKRNAIPLSARAEIALSASAAELAREYFQEVARILPTTLLDEEGLVFSYSEPTEPKSILAAGWNLTHLIIGLLHELPHGIFGMSEAVEGLVETSTNLAIVDHDGERLRIQYSTRSAVDSLRDDLRDKIGTIGQKCGATATQVDPYPGWAPQPDSEIIALTKQAYAAVGQELKTSAIHAGLECGVIMKKYHHLQAISIGPTILGAHTTSEQLHVPSAERFYWIIEALLGQVSIGRLDWQVKN